MRHFLLLLILSLTFYFGWQYAAKRDKNRLKRFGSRHVFAVIFILTTLSLLLLAMFHSSAINIL